MQHSIILWSSFFFLPLVVKINQSFQHYIIFYKLYDPFLKSIFHCHLLMPDSFFLRSSLPFLLILNIFVDALTFSILSQLLSWLWSLFLGVAYIVAHITSSFCCLLWKQSSSPWLWPQKYIHLMSLSSNRKSIQLLITRC